ncbi:MAG TPA: tetratricopeptide repeat protein [Chloroflexia bacterium]|jgi:predicted ATPase/DNA-binding CsgD family transcriptional regulator
MKTEATEQISSANVADAAPRVIRNLPGGWTTFIGREAEVRAVSEILSRPHTQLLTLVGPPGVGKTRLAVEVARQAAAGFEYGAVFVPLASVKDVSEVPNQIAKALGLQQNSMLSSPFALASKPVERHTLDETLLGFLRGTSVLLVLDNTEQIDNIANAILQLLDTDPSGERLRVIVTGRVSTRVSIEVVYSVPPLKLPDLNQQPSLKDIRSYDAVQFFLSLARQKKPELKIDSLSKAAAVVQICALADALPLGIQIAVGRLKQWSLPTLANIGRSDILRLSNRDINAPESQQSMERSISLSYDRLDSTEQTLFCRLSVFQGICRADAVREVCTADGMLDPATVDDLLWDLGEKSLLQPIELQGEVLVPHYSLLPIVRQYAYEKFAGDAGRDDIMWAYANYYLDLVRQARQELGSNRQMAWLQRLSSEENNLRSALDWLLDREQLAQALQLSASLWQFWWIKARFSEGARWLDRALALAEARYHTDNSDYADGNIVASVFALEERRLADAARYLDKSEHIHRTTDNHRGIAYTLIFKSALANAQGSTNVAALHIEESVALLRTEGDQWGLALALYYAGYASEGDDTQFITWEGVKDTKKATAAYEESRSLFGALGDDWGLAMSTIGLANLLYRNRRREEAVPLYEEGVRLLRRVGAFGQMCYPLSALGNIALAQGIFEAARGYFEEALPIHRKQNNIYSLAYAYNGLGEIARHEGRYAEAVPYYESAIGLHRDLRASYAQAGDTKRQLEVMFPEAWALQNLAAAWYFLNADSNSQVRAYYEEALTLFRQIGFLPGTRPGMISCLGGIAAVSSRDGDHRLAAALFGAADAKLQVKNAKKGHDLWLQPADLAHYDAVKLEAKQRTEEVNPDLWEKNRRAGRKLTWEMAVSIALGETALPIRDRAASDFTARELEVLKLMADGMKKAEIMDKLSISYHTLVEHERRIRRKRGVKRTMEAVIQARNEGLLD